MKRRLVLAALVGVAVGVSGESLLFLQRQAHLAEAGLRDDFRVLLYLKADLDESKQKVVAEQLRALPEVDDVRAVSRQEQLSALRRDDPELVESVLLVGDNPLMPAFEVRLAQEGLAHVGDWLAKAQGVADFADARYKPAQIQAILQAQFYARFIDVALSALVCAAAALLLAGLWAARRARAALSREQALPAALAGACALAAAGSVALLVLPMKALSPWWGLPGPAAQALLAVAAAGAGWVLCARIE